jgi:hypothetical protein
MKVPDRLLVKKKMLVNTANVFSDSDCIIDCLRY